MKIDILITLCGDEPVENLFKTISNIDAAARPMGKPFGIVVACAENTERFERGLAALNEGLSTNVIFCDMSYRDYQSVAQLKNAAMSFCDGDYIAFVEVGMELSVDYFEKLWKNRLDRKSVADIIRGGMGCVKGLMLDRQTVEENGGFNGIADDNGMELLARILVGGGSAWAIIEGKAAPDVWPATDLYAYVLGKYASLLKNEGMFDEVVGAYLGVAAKLGIQAQFVERLSHMMAKDGEFERLEDCTRPVVIYMGDPICYDVLTCFAREFSEGLRRHGVPVIMYDMSVDGTTGLARFVDKRYRCVVGFQTALMSVTYDKSDRLVNNRIGGPKVNFLYDHPLYLYYFFRLDLENQWVLTQDERYAGYINKYYPKINKAYHLPPAGIELEDGVRNENAMVECGCDGATDGVGHSDKIYDISFVASYHDYRERMLAVERLEEPYRSLATEWMKLNIENPLLSAEEAMACVMKARNESWSDEEFALNIHKCMDANRVVMFYYREKIVEMLVNAGIQVDVFGDTWNNCPLKSNPKLVIHGDVGFYDGIRILSQSRIALNVMSWHKAGMTERIANSMLNHAVCLTDTSDYIEKHFTDGEDIVLYRLDRLEELPTRVAKLLENDGKLMQIANNAYLNASANHRWCNRVREFVGMLESGMFE